MDFSHLYRFANNKTKRISSWDQRGMNRDYIFIEPGEEKILADIKGPGAIHHIWVTIAAEPFYGRKIILRMFWDGEDSPSVESPIGDFFGVGHGLNRNLTSLPISCSSEGRARNCYWYMPFWRSARITATNQGSQPVGAFYYYIDYRELPELPEDTPYFHAQYRQGRPHAPPDDYTILETTGRGNYVGTVLSAHCGYHCWFGEGNDRIFIDGESTPSLTGTGTEDYFNDGWGFRVFNHPYAGCIRRALGVIVLADQDAADIARAEYQIRNLEAGLAEFAVFQSFPSQVRRTFAELDRHSGRALV